MPAKKSTATKGKPAASKAAPKKSAAAGRKSAAAKKTSAAKKAPVKKAAAKTAAAAKSSSKKKTTAKKSTAKKSTAAENAAPKKESANKAASKAKTTKPASAKAAPKKAPVKAMAKSPFGTKFIDAQKVILQSERERYLRSAITWKAEADELMESREPGDVQFDEESGEGDSLAVERERDLVLSARARDTIDQIDEALKRIDDGVYGVCVISGKAIPKERLQAIPWAAERVECKVGTFGRR